MTTITANTDEDPPPTVSKATLVVGWRSLAALAALGLGIALAWAGGLWTLPGGLLAAAGGAVWATRAQRPARSGSTPGPGPGGRHGAEVMVSQVVPVWSRQMEVTRDAANDGLAKLLQSFSDMSGTLGQLTNNLSTFSVTAEPGAVGGAVQSEAPALSALCAASERAFNQRDAAVAALGETGEGLTKLQHLARRAREIARHTRLVAFNASIEANRVHQGEGGSQAVAVELRVLAGRMADTGEQIERGVLKLTEIVRKARRAGEANDTTPDELRLEIDIRAREALNALLGALGASLQGSQQVRDASDELRNQIDEAFVHFQFGDRVSQMMSIVASDMSNFARWVAENPTATQTDAAEWLDALEASYTMEEQRSQHHGNVHVERSSEVEFF